MSVTRWLGALLALIVALPGYAAVTTGTITFASTDTVGTTKTVSGLSFAPTWCYLAWSGRPSAGQGEADSLFGQGIFTSTSNRRAYTTQSDHSPTTTASDAMWRQDGVVATLSTAGAIVGRADVDAMTSDGFRLIVDDQFPASLIVGYICGDGANVAINDITEPGGTGNQDYNVGFALNTGLDDKFLIAIGGPQAAVNTSDPYSSFSFGVAAGDTIGQATLSGSSQDAAATSITCGYSRAGEFLSLASEDNVFARASVTTWLSTGFRLNWAEVPGGTFRWSVLTVQDSNKRFTVGDALTSTGTSNQVENTSYTPVGVLIGSAGRAASSADTTTAQDERIIGAATGASARWTAALLDKDNSGNADIGVAFSTDAMYLNQSTAATIIQEGAMDLVSFDATPSFTYVMDDADPSQAFFFELVFSEAPAAGGTIVNPINGRGGAAAQPVAANDDFFEQFKLVANQ